MSVPDGYTVTYNNQTLKSGIEGTLETGSTVHVVNTRDEIAVTALDDAGKAGWLIAVSSGLLLLISGLVLTGRLQEKPLMQIKNRARKNKKRKKEWLSSGETERERPYESKKENKMKQAEQSVPLWKDILSLFIKLGILALLFLAMFTFVFGLFRNQDADNVSQY